MKNKIVNIKIDSFDKEKFAVTKTENGYQWIVVFTGTEEECLIVAKAFKEVGYKNKKSSAKKITSI